MFVLFMFESYTYIYKLYVYIYLEIYFLYTIVPKTLQTFLLKTKNEKVIKKLMF